MEPWARAREAFFGLWVLTLAFKWLAPDDGATWVVVVQAVLAALWAGCGAIWLGGWVRARRRGDPAAVVDARVVLACGALAAGGIALLVHWLTGSDGGALLALVAGVTLAVAGYLYAASVAAPR